MTLSKYIKYFDAFKVYGSFMIPKEDSKSGYNYYSIHYGSIPGFVFTLMASLISVAYLVPNFLDMQTGNKDIFRTSYSDFFDNKIHGKFVDLNGMGNKGEIGTRPLILFKPFNYADFLN